MCACPQRSIRSLTCINKPTVCGNGVEHACKPRSSLLVEFANLVAKYHKLIGAEVVFHMCMCVLIARSCH